VPVAGDLPDVNVWLALSFADHVHHVTARRYWYAESAEQIAFCRVSALGYLRLATNAVAMGGRPLSTTEAWKAYRAFRRLTEVTLAPEPDGCEAVLGEWLKKGRFPPRLMTDAYLAAFASSAGLRLVTFDADFERFDGIELKRLETA
jgi:uncharacterized protein